ncbi:hypothetical protein FHG64_02795 [Antarcticibacterium flavum]|uniref:Type I restriction enzyme R protein N-terminal domain-containing protein n=1 Tax=Antarcticibacterium flavum TaxID=2058175 RepID=A0A5B7X132_9FLAO|nr:MULTISPECIES: type I restriction enzyme HsdR N-terminal domain-containing protein [Antarcticibacterium]MCM4161693.1 hypothetical protein [Antarcticibacterium sp. W02-3]QCY68402.1 hypothetical protein FHG64_02795 [Antarcticibacterium flavum]
MENWNKLCYYLSEKIQTDIPENEFEPIVEKGLEILGWDEFSGDFEIRPNYQLGSTKNSLRPDFVVKQSETGEKLFVVEIKRPKVPLSSQNQTQLSTYMRQFKLDFGILIGPQIQIFYDGNLNINENATLIENIEFKRDNEKGKHFVDLFSKESFNKNELYDFAKRSFKKINERETEKEIKKEILSNDFKEVVWDLIIKKLSTEYDINLVSKVIENIRLEISEKNSQIPEKERAFKNNNYSGEIYSNDILPIQLNPPSEKEFKERLLSSKTAYITIFYKDGRTRQKVWNANRFNESSHLLGNIRSRPDFRNGNWQKLKIEKVLVSIYK